MRRFLTSALVIAAAAAAPGAQQSTHPVSIADLLSLKQVTAPSVSPDGRMVVYAVRAWENGSGANSQRKEMRSHVWRVNSDGTGVRQLTFSDRGESAPQWSPDGKAIAFLSARGSDGSSGDGDGPTPQIWVMPADGGEAWKLTDAKEPVGSFAWAPTAGSIAYVSRDPLSKEADDKRKRRDDPQVFEDDFRMSHLFVVDVASHDTTEVLHDAHLTVRGEPSWSPDASRIALAAAPTTMVRDNRSDIFIVSVAQKTAERITTNPNGDSDPVWSPDGATIAYLSQAGNAKALPDGTMPSVVGNDHLMLYEVASRKVKDVARREFDRSPGRPYWSADSRTILFSAGVKTYRELFSFDVASGAYTQITHGRVATLASVAHDRLALIAETAADPPELYFAAGATAPPQRITDANAHTREFALGQTEVVSWKSDNFTIEGVLLKPVNYQPGKRYPLLVVAHGGPSSAFLDNYRVGYGDGGQNWAGEGWAVLYPNPRGSTNYGDAFERANFNDWGGGDYRDIMSGVDAMIARGIADPDRLALQGWSYGGYLTCWIVSQTPRFKAAMQGAGLTDLPSMYGTNDIPNTLVPYFGGMLTKETMGLYVERSGFTYADRVTTPLLLLHGGSDQRVPIGQPMEFYRALKDRGKTVELVFYPREGHGFTEYYHQLDRMQRQHDWIVKYTLGESGTKQTAAQ